MSNSDDQTVVKKRGQLLPHWTMKNAIYSVCFRLADSIPEVVKQSYKFERAAILKRTELTKNEISKLNHLFSTALEESLDKGYGKCYLQRDDVAGIVISTLEYFDFKRYILHTWCIMPNHIHLIVEPFAGFELFTIIHTWKSYSANQIKKLLNLKNSFWHKDAYNHIIRCEKEYSYQMEYIWNNPEKAGLENWKYRYRRVV
jgi:REP element-mobilizing transposase RayT